MLILLRDISVYKFILINARAQTVEQSRTTLSFLLDAF